MLAVPLLTRRGEPALGTVTLVRTGHPEYELGELGLLQQLAEHLALALGADRTRPAGAAGSSVPAVGEDTPALEIAVQYGGEHGPES